MALWVYDLAVGLCISGRTFLVWFGRGGLGLGFGVCGGFWFGF